MTLRRPSTTLGTPQGKPTTNDQINYFNSLVSSLEIFLEADVLILLLLPKAKQSGEVFTLDNSTLRLMK